MERFGKFLIFLGILCIIIGFIMPRIIRSEDPGRGYLLITLYNGRILIPVGIFIAFIGLILKNPPSKTKSSGIDLQSDKSSYSQAQRVAIHPETDKSGASKIQKSTKDVPKAIKKGPVLKKIEIKPGYSYAREMLEHIHKLTSETKTMEILDDIVRIIDEYAYSLGITKVSSWNFVELAQFVAERKNWGFKQFREIEAEVKILKPLLAGLKILVLVGDCDVHKDEIPDGISEILQIDGPPEVDDVIRYLLSQFGYRSKG